ncbi:hypothetical protein GCM10008090_15160 [Arenicella chitinivorans]|uniref:DUF883 domain-containing protein n=1 Tax=Arenicella chitinivorans TaxID=1329800 RepID=A0A918RQM4_9GAMM|nr:DUF883 family protein [Arenicella chitinivorans]GHA06453.1 hypothetical protein GCM10008090_15160 [Arenicella chitinivorans]
MAKSSTTRIQQVANKAHDAVDKTADAAENVDARVRETAEQVKAKTNESVDTMKTASANAQQTVTDYVNDNPMKALGIAFGAGVIATAILRK